MSKLQEWRKAFDEWKEQREFKGFHREFEDRVDRSPAPLTITELRELETMVQEASAYHRSRDPGEFSDERRALLERDAAIAEKFHVSRAELDQPILSLRQFGPVTPREMEEFVRTDAIDGKERIHAKPEAIRELDRGDEYEMGGM